MPALPTGSRGRSRDTQPKPCSRASGSLWLGGGTAAGPRRGLCLQNTSPDSHPHPSSTQGSFLTVRNPKLEKPGWGGGRGSGVVGGGGVGEKQAFNLKQQHVGKQPGGRWKHSAPGSLPPQRPVGHWFGAPNPHGSLGPGPGTPLGHPSASDRARSAACASPAAPPHQCALLRSALPRPPASPCSP